MSESLYAIGDIGGTNLRLGIYNEEFECLGAYYTGTEPENYDGTVQLIADHVEMLSGEKGKAVAASFAVAAEVDDYGVLTKSGALHPWIGRNLSRDLGRALNLYPELVGTPNDVAAVAISQQEINRLNGR